MATYVTQSIEAKPFANNNYGFFDMVGDQIALSELKTAFDRTRGFAFPTEDDYVWSDNVPVGYEEHADDFATTGSRAEAAWMKNWIDERYERKRQLGNEGIIPNIASAIVAGFVDPLNYVPIPAMSGVGFVKGALRGSVSTAALAAAGEGLRAGVDPTFTLEDAAWNVGGGAIFGGLLGGGLGKFGPAGDSVATGRVDPRVDQAGSRYFRTFSEAEGLHVTDVMDVDGLPYQVRWGAPEGTNVEFRPAREETRRIVPLREEQIEPRINDPIYHGTRENNIASFVDGEGNLILRFSENFNGRQVGVSFTDKRDVAVGYANRTPGIGTPNPNPIFQKIRYDNISKDPLTSQPRSAEVSSTIVNYSGRHVVIVDVNGVRVPFYLSTGEAGKSAPSGRWYPFFGIGKDGWINKTNSTDMVNYYGSAALRRTAEYLDKNLGDTRKNPNIPKISRSDANFFASLRDALGFDGVPYTGGIGTEALRSNIINTIAKVERGGARSSQGGDKTQGIIFAIDRGAVPDLRVEAMGELFHMTDQDLVIPAGRWRAEKPTPEGVFEPPPYYIRMLRDVEEVLPAREAEIVINDVAILGSFSERPWTRMSDMLPENAFNTKEEWLNFNILKALQERVNPRRPDETAAEYQTRMTNEAYIEYRAGKLPLRPAGNLLERVTIAGTLPSQALKLFGNDQQLMDLFLSVGGDFSLLNTANRAGKDTPDSVFLRAHQRIGQEITAYYDQMQKYYSSYLTSSVQEPSLTNLFRNAAANAPGVGRLVRAGKMKRSEFNEMVGYVTEQQDAVEFRGRAIPDAVRSAARDRADFFKKIEEEARSLGMFDAQRSTQRALDFANRRIQKLNDLIPTFRVGSAVRTRMENDLSLLQQEVREYERYLAQLAETPVQVRGAQYYMPHVWLIDKIQARREEFTEKLTRLYARDKAQGARERAEKSVRRLLGEEADEAFTGSSSAPFLKSREIPANFKEFSDFLELDIDVITRSYIQRMMPTIEMTRRFGDRNMSEAIGKARERLYEKLAGVQNRKEAARIFDDTLQLLEDTRDRVLGTFGSVDATTMSARAARGIKNIANLALMGGTIFASLTDAGRTIGVFGPKNVYKGMIEHFRSDLKDIRIAKSYAKAAGEATELVNGHILAGLTGSQSIIRAEGTMAERAIDRMTTGMFIANGLTPWTVGLKKFNALLSGHVLIDEAKTVAAAIQRGVDPNPKMVARLASVGINTRDAQLIASMPVEKPNELWLLNMTNWTGREGNYARQKMLSAMGGEIRRSVITPGVMDRPRIFDGVIYSRKERAKIERQMAEKRFEIDRAKERISEIRRLTRGGDPEVLQVAEAAIQRIVANIKQLGTEIGTLRSGQARAARKGNPLLALPFQFAAFPMAAAGKLAHSAISGRDRAAITGTMALVGFAWLGGYLKAYSSGDWAAQEYLDRDLDEQVYDSIDKSGMMFWLSNVGTALDVVADAGPRSALGLEQPFGEPKMGDKIGRIAGAGPGLIYNFGDALINPDYGADERAQMLRRTLPFNNLFWFKDVVKTATDAMADLLD